MKRLIYALALICAGMASAFAQSTAMPVVPGYLTITGCKPSTATPCFVQYSTTNPLPVSTIADGTLSTLNSTNVVLAGGATYTGTWENVLRYGSISVAAGADVISAIDGLQLQWSDDCSTLRKNGDQYTVFAGTQANSQLYLIPRQMSCFRVVYINGASAQTNFSIQTIFNPQMPSPSSSRPGDATSQQTDAVAVKSFRMLLGSSGWNMGRDVTGAPVTGVGVTPVAQIPTSTATAAPLLAVTNGAQATLVVKASAGNSYGVAATNLTATAGFLVGYNATAAPADGALTGTLVLECLPLPPYGYANPGQRVKRFPTGITYFITSAATCYTKTTDVITGMIEASYE